LRLESLTSDDVFNNELPSGDPFASADDLIRNALSVTGLDYSEKNFDQEFTFSAPPIQTQSDEGCSRNIVPIEDDQHTVKIESDPHIVKIESDPHTVKIEPDPTWNEADYEAESSDYETTEADFQPAIDRRPEIKLEIKPEIKIKLEQKPAQDIKLEANVKPTPFFNIKPATTPLINKQNKENQRRSISGELNNR
jgi:hypothetical protein